MKENQRLVSGSGEIDLSQLLTTTARTVKTNFILLIAAIVLGVGLGFMYFKLTSRVYESEMLITSGILTESNSKSIFNDLQKLIRENNHPALSSSLYLSESQASTIVAIKLMYPSMDGNQPGQESKTYMNITIKSLDNTIWPNLQKGLVAFMENQDFVKIRVAQNKKYYTSLIAKIDHELNDLEIMKHKIMEGKLSSNSMDGMVLLDPTMINSKILDLNKEKLGYQNALDLISSVQIVDPFTTFEKPISPKLPISLLAGSALGLIIAIIFLGVKSSEKPDRPTENKI